MSNRELIDRLLFLAQTAVDQVLNLDYDDPEDYFIYRELRELKAAAAAALAEPEPPMIVEGGRTYEEAWTATVHDDVRRRFLDIAAELEGNQ